MRRSWVGLLAALLAGSAAAAGAQSSDPLLSMGIRQFQEGDFEAAVFTLDSAVRNLSRQPERAKELARAYVYLGASYVGLQHEDAAKGKFREAIALDPELRLSRDEFPARVVALFETQALKRTAATKKRGARRFLILGGLAGAGAVGVAAATKGNELPPNRPPIGASIGIAPEGQVLSSVTILTLTASASDPDADALTHRWDFGDGVAAEGASVTHVYQREGTFGVRLTVGDGRGGSVMATTSVTVGRLDGSWQTAGHGSMDDRLYHCVQAGSAFDCPGARQPEPCLAPSGHSRCVLERWHGTLGDPRRIIVNLQWDSRFGSRGGERCLGEVSSDLNVVRCNAESGPTWQFERR